MKAKNISFSSILVGLTILFLYLSFLIPTNTITFLTLASLIIPISIISISPFVAFLIYIASSILSIIIIPFNITLLYILFFGLYGFIKKPIEKFTNLFLEILLKLCYFNFNTLILYLIFKSLIININMKFPLIFIVIASQIVFLLYDYALSILITFYTKKIYPYINR